MLIHGKPITDYRGQDNVGEEHRLLFSAISTLAAWFPHCIALERVRTDDPASSIEQRTLKWLKGRRIGEETVWLSVQPWKGDFCRSSRSGPEEGLEILLRASMCSSTACGYTTRFEAQPSRRRAQQPDRLQLTRIAAHNPAISGSKVARLASAPAGIHPLCKICLQTETSECVAEGDRLSSVQYPDLRRSAASSSKPRNPIRFSAPRISCFPMPIAGTVSSSHRE